VKLYRTLPRHDSSAPCAVTIGNFDGVHRGHRAILQHVVQAAHQQQLCATAVSFVPHPRAFFGHRGRRPELIPTQISSLRDKARACADVGLAQLVLLRFDQTLADMTAQNFIQQLLVDGLNTRWLLVGEDFRFGHQRAGDLSMLREAGHAHGFSVHTLADIIDTHGTRISSSEVRAALATGNLARARNLLGHTWHLSGHVIHGQKLGRTIGYPTLNLRVPPLCALRSGVYVVRVHGLAEQALAGVASLGVRPTVAQTGPQAGRLLLEVYLLDCSPDAYGKLARVEFLQYLRDEEKFPDLTTMTAVIEQDVRSARGYFAHHGLPKDA